MRKFALASVALVLSVGLVLAAEVTFVKYDKEKKELTVKEKDDEMTYKITDDTKFFTTVKGEKKDMETEKALKQLEKMEDDGKAKGKAKMEIKVEKKKLTEVEFKRGKKKDKN